MMFEGKKVREEEDMLQEAAVLWAREALLPFYFIFAVPNGGKRAMAEAKRLKRTGTLAGVPDLIVVGMGGGSFFIEMKTATGVLHKAQRVIRKLLAALGAPYAVCRTLPEFKAALRDWGLVSTAFHQNEASPRA